MKFNFNKYFLFALAFVLIGLSSCELENIADPNGASLEGVTSGASQSDLQVLVTGTENLLRNETGFYYDVTSIIGRDYYFFTGSDPRYTGELLGKEESQLDNGGFYGTRPFAARYRTVKNTNILITAVENSDAGLTDAQKNGYYGFAKTIQAYELLLVLNLQYNNGIRLDVSDPNNLSPFVDYNASLAGIANLLDEANTNLSSAGDEFAFILSDGWSGFNTPVTFQSFNRGLAARVALYSGKKDVALSALAGSFMDLMADLYTGPASPYSTAGGELTNPVFRVPNSADGIIAHPDFISTIDLDNDARASKVAQRDASLTLDGLTGDYDVVVYKSLSDYIYLLRNEELILIYAEANIGTNNAEAIAAIDVIRTSNGLDAYAGGNSDSELLNEVVAQRRLSLYGEGHRWVDMRRLGRLGELPIDRAGDDVWEQLPRPDTED